MKDLTLIQTILFNMKNYIPINRKLFTHYLWEEQRSYSKFEAWLDLLQMVSYKDNNSNIINGKLIKWNRGQYPISYSFLEKRWCWSVSKIRVYLTLLENDKMIARQTARGITTLSICKYDSYNVLKQGEGTTSSKAMAGAGQQLNKDNKEERRKEVEAYAIKLAKEENKNEIQVVKLFNRAFEYYAELDFKNSNGKEVKNIKSTIRNNWYEKEKSNIDNLCNKPKDTNGKPVYLEDNSPKIDSRGFLIRDKL